MVSPRYGADRPFTRTLAIRSPAGSRSRSVKLPRAGASTVPSTERPCASRSYETTPKPVGTPFTAIRLPGASQPRGVANASSTPVAVSCTSISRSVSRNEPLPAPFGGRYIAR